ncbi:MAG: homoserine dehydrogenase, partial [Candidatus Hydrogenedentes bacterium]|nr:homoserine dehydrogenase [Candidatus Hydrogenedentota bacterium]
RIGVGVIGAGTVGGGVIKALQTNHDQIAHKAGVDVALVHVADLRQECLAEFDLMGVTVSGDAEALVNDPAVDVVCELIGGTGAAKTFILKALNARKNVVTANKMLLAKAGVELCQAAIANGVELRYEASVAGGIPIIKALREGLAANRIEFIYGILNGTCNYILSRMTYDGLEFDAALSQAQALGFAETPPDLDIEGHDTAHKCQILASLCYSTQVPLESVYVEGITKVTRDDVAYAGEMGYLIKLLAIIRSVDGGIEARVHPTLVPETHLLASVRNEFNAVYVKGDIVDATLYYGRGAGRMPTASAVLADIIGPSHEGADMGGPGQRPVAPVPRAQPRQHLTRQGSAEAVARRRAQASCIQRDPHGKEHVHVVMMTHETTEAALRAALARIEELDCIEEPTHVLRVLG